VYSRGHWSTPCELFSPYYGASVANWIVDVLSRVDERQRCEIEIVEIGGGSGALARDVLDTLADSHSAVYERVSRYTSVELTPQLANEQRARLDATRHSDRYAVVGQSFVDYQHNNNVDNNSNNIRRRNNDNVVQFVLASEVLDNLAHDKLLVAPLTSSLPVQAFVTFDPASQSYQEYIIIIICFSNSTV
jgi:SAM-dependent MidA family methyltransferase